MIKRLEVMRAETIYGTVTVILKAKLKAKVQKGRRRAECLLGGRKHVDIQKHAAYGCPVTGHHSL